MQTLEAVGLKWGRAKKHFQDLDIAVKDFYKRNPCPVARESIPLLVETDSSRLFMRP